MWQSLVFFYLVCLSRCSNRSTLVFASNFFLPLASTFSTERKMSLCRRCPAPPSSSSSFLVSVTTTAVEKGGCQKQNPSLGDLSEASHVVLSDVHRLLLLRTDTDTRVGWKSGLHSSPTSDTDTSKQREPGEAAGGAAEGEEEEEGNAFGWSFLRKDLRREFMVRQFLSG